MKKIIILICAAFIALSFTSCKKCTHCTATHTATGILAYDYGEYCATPKEIKDYEAAMKELYPSPEYTCTCTSE